MSVSGRRGQAAGAEGKVPLEGEGDGWRVVGVERSLAEDGHKLTDSESGLGQQ